MVRKIQHKTTSQYGISSDDTAHIVSFCLFLAFFRLGLGVGDYCIVLTATIFLVLFNVNKTKHSIEKKVLINNV